MNYKKRRRKKLILAIVTFLSLGSIGLQNVYADIIISSDSGNYSDDITAKAIRFYDQDQGELESIIIPSTENAEYYLHINKGGLQNVKGMVIHDEDASRPGLSVPHEDTFASIDDIADAINGSGFSLKIGEQEIAPVRPGDKMTLTAGKNLTVVSNRNDNFTGGDGSTERVERGIQYSLADDISLNGITITPTKSTVGNTIRLDGNGLSLNSNDGSNPVYIRSDEINMGGHIIDNLHSGFVDPDGAVIGIENLDMEELAKRNDPMKVAENAANIGDLAQVYTALDNKKADEADLDAKANTNLDNITKDGQDVIRNLAKGSVKVIDGQNTTVTEGKQGDATTYAVNVSADAIKGAVQSDLDAKANKDASNLDASDVTKWQDKLGNGSVTDGNTGLITGDTVYEAVKDKANTNLDNITKDGQDVIRNLAKGSVKVIDGQNTTVTEGKQGDATTYAVNVSNDAIKGAVQSDLDKKANTDASNLSNSDVAKWQDKLGNGSISEGNTGLVTGGTVYEVVKNAAGNRLAVSYDSADKDHITLKGQDGTIISNVKNGSVAPGSKDAVNGGQLYETNSRINQLGNDIKHVGATSAALAGLHPQDFDEHYKFTVAAARGSYDGASAYALGAFYRPNSDLMVNAASTISFGKNAYTVGISYKFGTSTKKSVLAENEALQDKVNRLEAMLNDIMNKLSTNTNSSSDTNTMVRK